MPPATHRMSAEERARYQVRIVRVVYRGESRRLDGRGIAGAAREEALGDLRVRSLELLGLLRSSLDRSEEWHAGLLAEVSELERELHDDRAADASGTTVEQPHTPADRH